MKVEKPPIESTPGPINFRNFLNRILTLQSRKTTVLSLPESLDIRGQVKDELERFSRRTSQAEGHIRYAEGYILMSPFRVPFLSITNMGINDETPKLEVIKAALFQQRLMQTAMGRIIGGNPQEFGAGTFITVEHKTNFILKTFQPTKQDLATFVFLARLNLLGHGFRAALGAEGPNVMLAGFASDFLSGIAHARPFVVYREAIEKGRPTGILQR